MTETSCPSSIRASARSLMCDWTPPGTSQEYGQTIPIFMARSSWMVPGRKVRGEDALEHVPVRRVFGDGGLEDPGQVLAHGRDLLGPGARLGHRDLVVDVRAPVLPLEPGRDRQQRGAGVHGQGGGRGDPRLLPEHLDLDAGV